MNQTYDPVANPTPHGGRPRQRRRRLFLAVAATAAAIAPVTFSAPAQADTPPARLVGLVSGNLLVFFDEANPGTITKGVAITGLQADEWVMSIEMRPGTGQLLGFAVTDTPGPDRGRLYTINQSTGAATPTGAATVDTVEDTARTTIDINPTVDRLRVVGSLDQSLRVNPNTGGLAATDTDFAPAGQEIVNVAYDQNIAATATGGTTTLFGISAADDLVRVGGVNGTPSPNLGALTTIGNLGVVADNDQVGFDISGQGTALASMQVGGRANLYRVDLTTGAATLAGQIGNGLSMVSDIAILSSVIPDTAGQYIAAGSPIRLIDTRSMGKVGAGQTISIPVRGQGGTSPMATSAVVNVTMTDPTAPGFTTVWPSGTGRPTTSSLNVDSMGQTRAALVSVALGSNGAIDVFSERGGHVIVDLVGVYVPSVNGAGHLVPLTPSRLYDTRSGIGVAGGSTAKPAAGATVDVAVLGRGGVPATNVSAVVVTLTATETSAPGFFTAFAGGTGRPNASNLNSSETGESIANLAIVPVGANGAISVFTERGSHLLVDVVGYFGSDPNALASAKGLFIPLTPGRLLDTRNAIGAPSGSVAAGGTISVQVTGRSGVPATGVLAFAGTVTADQSQAAGFATAFPAGVTRPDTSTLNLVRAGQTIAGATILGLPADGRVSIYNNVGTHLLTDVTGYFIG